MVIRFHFVISCYHSYSVQTTSQKIVFRHSLKQYLSLSADNASFQIYFLYFFFFHSLFISVHPLEISQFLMFHFSIQLPKCCFSNLLCFQAILIYHPFHLLSNPHFRESCCTPQESPSAMASISATDNPSRNEDNTKQSDI